MHHLSHLTNDYVNLLKGRAPSSTLKVPFHTFSSVCYYNTPEDVGELRGEVHSSFCPALLCSHFSFLQKESGLFWVQVPPIYARREHGDGRGGSHGDLADIEKGFQCISNIEAFQHLHHSWPFSHLMTVLNLGTLMTSGSENVFGERKSYHLTDS